MANPKANIKKIIEGLLAEVQFSGELFRNCADTSTESIIVYKDKKIVYVNKRTVQLSGITREALIGQPLLDFVLPQERKRMIQLMQSREKGIAPLSSFETVIVLPNAQKKRVEISGVTLKPGKGATVLLFLHDLTPRDEAYEELLKFSRAVTQIADSLMITDKNSTIQYVNPAFERITGYSAAEVIGKNANVLASGKHTKAFYRELWDVILKGETFRATFINKRKDGALYYLEQAITPIRNWENEITHFVATGRDITAQKRAQEALEDSEQQKQAVLDTIPDLIFRVDPEGTILETHGAMGVMSTLAPNLVGRKISDFVSANYAHKASTAIGQALATGKVQQYEYIRETHGETRLYDIRVVKINIAQCLAIVHDTTDKQKLAEMSKRYDFIVNTSKDHMSLINRKYRYEAVNEAYCKAQRKAREQIIGKSVKDIWGRKRFDKYIKVWLDECFSGKEVRNHAWFEFGKRGKRYLEATYYPYFSSPDNVTHAIVITHDLTERKKTEEQLDELYKTQAKLFAEIAHSLKTPFTVVLGNIDTLAKKIAPAVKNEILNNIKSSISAANEKVTELLKIAKMQLFPAQLNLVSADLDKIIGDVYTRAKLLYRSYYPDISQKQLSQNLVLSIHTSGKLTTSPTVLSEILLMLVENSILYSPKHDALPQITLKQKITRKSAILEVSDKGRGMTQVELEHAFELHYTSGKTGHYGIGLPYCQKMAQALGGNIGIQSRLHKGTTVRVSIPIKQTDAATAH